MSKSVKMIVGVAAAIAIPFAAPLVATAIAGSFGVAAMSATAMTLSSAAVGAGMGALSSAALGQNIGRGALMGGIGGGIGGYASAASTASAASAAPGSGASLPSMGGGTGLTGTADAAFGAQQLGAGADLGSAGISAGAGTGLSTGAGGGAGLSLPSIGYNSPSLAAGAGTGAGTGASSGLASGMGGGTGLTLPAGGYSPAGLASGMGGGTGLTVPSAMASTAPSAAAAPTTFMDALSKVPSTIASRFSDPNALADLTLRAAGQLAGSAIAGDGLSSEEKQLLDAQTAELRNLQTQNAGLFNQKLEQAQALIGESKYFDPEYFGLQRARRTQVAGARAKQAGLRGLTGGAREAEGRRFDLATGRDTGTAYDVGYGTAVGGRLQTQQAGLSAFPSAYPSSFGDYANLSRAYGAASDRSTRQAEGIGNLFGSITGRAESTANRTV